MKKQYFLLVFIALFLGRGASFAQLVGGNVYLQGQWLEVGEIANGALGTCVAPPAGYHPDCAACPWPNAIAQTYDWGHDGWTVGSPAFMGDYTNPGYPFEGWSLEINGNVNEGFQNYCAGGFACCLAYTAPSGTLTGGITGYSNTGGRAIANWAGTASAGNLTISQETRVDTEASWVVFTTIFRNIGSSPITNVYYERTCDPDNASSWGGGSSTVNTIVYQNDIDHRVMVSSYVNSGTFNKTNTYMALGTKDCRAICTYFSGGGLQPGYTPDKIWSKATPYTYTAGSSLNNDIGYALVYNIGTITAAGTPGDSAVISYAYMFDGDIGIDSAFPDPVLSINATPITIYPDTFDACAFPKLDSVPLSVLFASDKDWTWSTWTWTPATGLSATTGVSIYADLTAIPGSVTYTVTGVDSNANGFTCNMKTFIFTIKSCHSAWSISPCYGGEILLGMHGDSTGATYKWTGPGGFTSTLHDPIINPAIFADSGLYRVIKTIGGINDTDSTYVNVYPKPVLILSDNGPLCATSVDTLLLKVLPVSAGEGFAWSGPNSFTSSIADPSIPGFITVDTGIYTLVGTSIYGCKDTNTVRVGMVYPPPAPPITGVPVYCYGAPFVPLSISGGGILWYYPLSTSPGVVTPPVVNTDAPGTYTFYATQTTGCISPQDSFTVVVKPEIFPGFTWTTLLGCTSDIVTFNNTSTKANNYTWDFGDGSGSADSTPVPHTYNAHEVYTVVLTAFTPGCSATAIGYVNTNHSVTAAFVPFPDTICAGTGTTTFTNNSTAMEASTAGGSPNLSHLTGTAGTVDTTTDAVPPAAYSWNFGDGTTDVVQSPAAHSYATGGVYNVNLTVTDSIGCQDTVNHPVFVLQLGLQLFHDTMLCISQPLPMKNVVLYNPSGKNLTLTDDVFAWTPNNSNISDTSIQIPDYTGFGLTTYTLTVTEVTYGCQATDTMRIHSVAGVVLSHVTASATIMYGGSIQLSADSEVYYLWKPDDGSLSNPNINDPIATPKISTQYTVLGYDKNGCLDSAYVDVTVDSTMNEDIPTGFTPNNDGLNDVFRPVGLKYQHMVEFRVYNRWGQQVFYSNNPEVGWDGTFNGVPQDIDVYYYVIIVARPGGSGDNIVYKGEVTLIR